MNKTQFIEKCLEEFEDRSKIDTSYADGFRIGCYECDNGLDKMSIKDFLQSKLSECWDMAGEEGEKNEDSALEERDNAEDWADQLANDISAVTGIEIGEHSNMNNPWSNALEALHSYFDSLTSKQEEE